MRDIAPTPSTGLERRQLDPRDAVAAHDDLDGLIGLLLRVLEGTVEVEEQRLEGHDARQVVRCPPARVVTLLWSSDVSRFTSHGAAHARLRRGGGGARTIARIVDLRAARERHLRLRGHPCVTRSISPRSLTPLHSGRCRARLRGELHTTSHLYRTRPAATGRCRACLIYRHHAYATSASLRTPRFCLKLRASSVQIAAPLSWPL